MQEEKDCLQAELKMMREDLHRIMLELTERRQRASKLQAKYETQCSKSIGAEGADESRSQVNDIQCDHSLAISYFQWVEDRAQQLNWSTASVCGLLQMLR